MSGQPAFKWPYPQGDWEVNAPFLDIMPMVWEAARLFLSDKDGEYALPVVRWKKEQWQFFERLFGVRVTEGVLWDAGEIRPILAPTLTELESRFGAWSHEDGMLYERLSAMLADE